MVTKGYIGRSVFINMLHLPTIPHTPHMLHLPPKVHTNYVYYSWLNSTFNFRVINITIKLKPWIHKVQKHQVDQQRLRATMKELLLL